MDEHPRRTRHTLTAGLILTLAALGGILSFLLGNYGVTEECPGPDHEGWRLPPAGDGYGLLCTENGPAASAVFAVFAALVIPFIAVALAVRARRLLVAGGFAVVTILAPFAVGLGLTQIPQDCTAEQWREHGDEGCATYDG